MKVLLLLLGIPALLLGLMAMQILSPESEAAPRSHAVVEALTASPDEEPCASSCATLHDIVTLACVLALGLGLLFLLPALVPLGLVARRPAGEHPGRSQVPHSPLSLELLSVSRR